MKKYNILLILLIALIFGACEKDDEKPVLDNDNATAAVMLSPAAGSTYIFTLTDAATDFDKISWSAANYGAKVPVDYSLELSTHEGFLGAVELASTANIDYTPTVGELNMLLFDMGITTATATEVFLRAISSSDHEMVKILAGESNSITITPFEYNMPNISAPAAGTSYVLEYDTIGVAWVEFTWNAVNYGEGFSPEYTLELDLVGNNFSTPTEIYSGTATAFTPTVMDINKILLDAGLEANVAAPIEFRVTSSVDGAGEVASDPSAYAITPFSAEFEEPPLYLVGAFQGWDNLNGVEIPFVEEGVYSGVVTITAEGMKILKTPGAWAPQWGDDGTASGVLSFRETEDVPDPDEIPSPGEGTYVLTVDIINLTYEFVVQ